MIFKKNDLRYAALSMLAPVIILPSDVKSAAPTGKLEYGEYAFCFAGSDSSEELPTFEMYLRLLL